MEIKGTAVKSIKEFVLNRFKDSYSEWFNLLSPESREVFKTVLSNGWYPLNYGIVEPTELIGKLFFEGDTHKAAWESGQFSAELALQGIYKIYVRFSSPSHVVDRGSRILPAYYNPITISQLERRNGFVKFIIKDCKEIDPVVEYRIGGWMYKALEISGCKTMEVKISESIKTHGRTIFDCSWT